MRTLTRRPDGSSTKLFQYRVTESFPDLIREAAARNGLTDSYYVDLLLKQLLDENGGRMPDVARPIPQREALFNEVAA